MMRNIKNLSIIFLKGSFTNMISVTTKKSKKSSDKTKSVISKSLLGMFVVGMLLYSLYTVFDFNMQQLLLLQKPYHILLMAGIYFNVMLMFFSTYEIQGHFIKRKDFDLLASMPIKTYEIVISKFISVLIYAYFYQLLFLLPAIIVLASAVTVSFTVVLYLMVGFVFLPLFSLALSTIISFIINLVVSRLRHKNLFSIIFMFLFVILIMMASFYLNSEVSATLITNENSQKLISIFATSTLFWFKAIEQSSVWLFFAFILVSLLSLVISVAFISLLYLSVNQHHKNHKKSIKIKEQVALKFQPKKPIFALIKQELKMYFNTPIYVFNSLFGSILSVPASIALLVYYFKFADESIFQIIPQKYVFILVVVVLTAFVSLTITTSSSVSLEGKNLYIKKSLPLKFKDIVLSKIALNVLVASPFMLLSFFILLPVMISVGAVWYGYIFAFVIPLLALTAIATLSLYVNFCFPKIEFSSEVEVVKQSFSVFITTFIGMFFVIIPIILYTLLLSSFMSINWFILAVGVLYSFIIILFYWLIITKGKTKFEKLN